MQDELKIVLIQSDLVWEQPEQNRSNFTNKIESIVEKVDVIVLPEMFSSGFTMNPSQVFEEMDGLTISWMKAMAKKMNAAICGSLVIKENDNYYNRFLFVTSDGEIKKYDKRHTFTLAGEHKVYNSGNELIIIDYKGWKLCPLICYDLRFPVWSRNTMDYDVLLYVANWPKPRVNAWDALLKARAIENMSYCIGVNRVGTDANNLEYSGHSAAYDCLGEKLSNIEPHKEQTQIISLDKNHLITTREKLKFLDDRDVFSLK